MQITGTAHMNALIPEAWAAFHDPGVLSRTIPGLQSLEQTGEDAYKATVKAGVASIKGTYVGNVALTEQVLNESFLLKASGEGGPGTISADVRVRLSPGEQGGTDIVWGADASVGGPIGGVGQRMLQGVARKMATQFFADIDADIARGGAEEGAASEQGAGPDVSSSSPQPGVESPTASVSGPAQRTVGRTFTAPAAAAPVSSSATSLLAAAALGAVVALLGVLVGQRSGRR